MYCAKFAELLHTMRTPNWSTVLYFNYVFRHTACIIMRYCVGACIPMYTHTETKRDKERQRETKREKERQRETLTHTHTYT